MSLFDNARKTTKNVKIIVDRLKETTKEQGELRLGRILKDGLRIRKNFGQNLPRSAIRDRAPLSGPGEENAKVVSQQRCTTV
jgi:hypothetical protein